MARPLSTDYILSMKFHADVIGQGESLLNTPQAGFSAITAPELTIEAVEYKEGQYVFPRKFPGAPTIGAECTLSRGVTKKDSSFWDWAKRSAMGTGEYRADVNIKQYARDALVGSPDKIDLDAPVRTYLLKEGFPSRVKVAGDMDATASEISLMEIDVAYEHFDVQNT